MMVLMVILMMMVPIKLQCYLGNGPLPIPDVHEVPGSSAGSHQLRLHRGCGHHRRHYHHHHHRHHNHNHTSITIIHMNGLSYIY